MTTTTPAHTCYGAVFTGHPAAEARAACPACPQPAYTPHECDDFHDGNCSLCCRQARPVRRVRGGCVVVSMSRKDYAAVAAALLEEHTDAMLRNDMGGVQHALERVACELARVFKRDNPGFNPNRFLRAALGDVAADRIIRNNHYTETHQETK